jgi:hypothetical protein
VEHPLCHRGALTIDEVRPDMRLSIFSVHGDQFLGEFEVEWIKDYDEIGLRLPLGRRAIVGTLTARGELEGKRCAELAFNLGLEPPPVGVWGAGPFDAYCVDKAVLEAAC